MKIYRDWLALVYTLPQERGKGYGTLLCQYMQEHAQEMRIENVYLFTDTAESLYKKLGWREIERLHYKTRNVIVMSKELLND